MLKHLAIGLQSMVLAFGLCQCTSGEGGPDKPVDTVPVTSAVAEVRASPTTTEATGIVLWKVTTPDTPGDRFVAVGLDESKSVRLELAVLSIPATQSQEQTVTIDVRSDTDRWQIVDGRMQGASPGFDDWTKVALSAVGSDLKDYQEALEDTGQTSPCFWCAISGLGCISITASCIASACGGVVACIGCIAGISASCGATGACCYECVKRKGNLC